MNTKWSIFFFFWNLVYTQNIAQIFPQTNLHNPLSILEINVHGKWRHMKRKNTTGIENSSKNKNDACFIQN